MKRGVAVLVSLALVSSLLWGCGSIEKGAATGAGIGALLGAGAGALLDKDKPARGALIGGLVGALAGGMIGHYYDQKIKGPPDQPPPKEVQLAMEEVWSDPNRITTGNSAKLGIRYTLLAPDFEQKVLVRERFSIFGDGKLIQEFGPLDRRRDSGTYASYMDIGFPESLSEGAYTMKGIVEASGKRAEGQTSFHLVKIITAEGYVVAIKKP
jgi:hypothetical protein